VRTFRLIILGAGFSKPAGLPLATELFNEVRKRVKLLHGSDNAVESDLDYYLNYLRKTENFSGSAEDIDVEKFLSFLDIEHYLELQGSNTWSTEGNVTQLLIRHAIGYIILDRMPKKSQELYKLFASKLNPLDWVITFNYDTLLEQALDAIGTPYRLFPRRYTEIVNNTMGIVESQGSEIEILKMHGSIDWFDRTSYDEISKIDAIDHPIFGPKKTVMAKPIVDGPRFENDPLLRIYRAENPAPAYNAPSWQCSPFLLTPSHSKLLYSKPLIDFWRGMANSGGLFLNFGIIGYSLPDYDDYARQAIYEMGRNYREFVPNLELGGRRKQPFRILDYKTNNTAKASLRKRYKFLGEKQTEYWYDGLSRDAIEWFMA
jgi:hypothetical protein